MFLVSLVAFALTVIIGPLVISQLKKFQFGQSIREEGPSSHKKKAGTPTIGGVIFLPAILITSLIFMDISKELSFLLLLTLGHGIIGFLDDFIKIKFKRNLGLTSKQKLFAQIILSLLSFWLFHTMNLETSVTIPIISKEIEFGFVGYLIFFLFLTVGTTNATNLTDGLDGLLTGLAVISFSAFGVISYMTGNTEIFTFCIIMAGSLLAFLIFNSNPAKIFMGDTGSLAIGGALVGVSVLTNTEMLLAVIGGVFVIETLSVILQVISFKTRKKRIFIMTPIHHSFEAVGWTEEKVVTRFWFLGIVFSLVGLTLFTL